jgi:TRAP-type mannitol/chloroaromatic compound transport system substrate-binding protein
MSDDNGYNVKTLPCGVITPETSGWFKKEINSVEDLARPTQHTLTARK